MSVIESKLSEKKNYKPNKDFTAKANIKKDDLNTLISSYVKNPHDYWEKLARDYISWSKDFTKVLSGTAPNYKWFEDGELNVSFNCLDRHANQEKDAIIHISEDNKKTILSYSQLGIMVKSFAFELSSIGLKKGDRVVIYMPTIPQSIAVMLACSRLGLIHSVVFAGFSAESLKDRINDCKASAVITVDSFLRNGKIISTKNTVNAALEFGCPSIKHLIIYNHNNTEFVKKDIDVIWNENLTKRSIDLDPIQMNSEDILFILYTSGSTGKPKGIVHSTGGYLLHCMLTNSWVFDLKDDDIFWCTADIGWITGHSYVVYGPLSMGATILIYDGAPTYPHIGRFWEIIEKNQVSVFYTAPTAIRTLMKLGENLPDDFDLESLRLLGTVGEPINPKAWEWYHSKIGSSKCPVVDTWWQTETGANMIAPIPGVTNTIPGTCTKPLPGIDVGVVDNDGIEIDEPNKGGNLVIKQPWPSMLRGVWGDNQRYLDTYWKKYSNKFYVTGDTARFDELGNIWIMGRADDVVNISGHRLGTMEIESSIVSHEYVAEAAVVSFKHEIKGEAIHAFVTLKDNYSQHNTKEFADEIRNWVKEKIGSIAKPDRISFSSGLPKTRSGKIMRRLLRNLARDENITGDISTLENEDIITQLRKTL